MARFTFQRSISRDLKGAIRYNTLSAQPRKWRIAAKFLQPTRRLSQYLFETSVTCLFKQDTAEPNRIPGYHNEILWQTIREYLDY